MNEEFERQNLKRRKDLHNAMRNKLPASLEPSTPGVVCTTRERSSADENTPNNNKMNIEEDDAEHKEQLYVKWCEHLDKACVLKITDIYRFVRPIDGGGGGGRSRGRRGAAAASSSSQSSMSMAASWSHNATCVVEAVHRKTRKRVAIKIIKKSKIKDKERLSHEINIMKQLKHHSCIVELYVSVCSVRECVCMYSLCVCLCFV